ncbi:MAG: hypothetical protein SGARI_007016, partial [Bacillariaceae sp.]
GEINDELNYTSIDNTTGAYIFDITQGDLAVKCRIDECTEEKVFVRKVVGPAKVTCPAGSENCVDVTGDNIIPPDIDTGGIADLLINENTYYCDDDCTVTEETFSVQGPAVVVCPIASVQCTGGPYSSTSDDESITIDVTVAALVQCSDQCQVEEQSLEVVGPAKATCPSDSVGCVDLGCTPCGGAEGDILTTDDEGGTFYCSELCQIDSSIEVHGPASIVCGPDTIGCTVAGASGPDGSSYTMECGEVGYCSKDCTVDGEPLDSGADSQSLRLGGSYLLVSMLLVLSR